MRTPRVETQMKKKIHSNQSQITARQESILLYIGLATKDTSKLYGFFCKRV
jgi:hypothetical protein